VTSPSPAGGESAAAGDSRVSGESSRFSDGTASRFSDETASRFFDEITGGCWAASDPTMFRIVAKPVTESTNDDVAAAARTGEPEGLVVVADFQRAGRGRRGRSWQAPPGTALTFSVLLRPARPLAPRWQIFPLLAGIAVVEGIRDATGITLGLKWPNDVVSRDDAKLGGILVERLPDADDALVVGIGLNVTLGRDQRPTPTATSLALLGAGQTSRGVLLRNILTALENWYRRWCSWAMEKPATGGPGGPTSDADPATRPANPVTGESGGPRPGPSDHVDLDPVLSAYREYSATIGRRVRVELADGTRVVGMATGIDPDGALLVDTDDAGARRVTAGEVVHLR